MSTVKESNLSLEEALAAWQTLNVNLTTDLIAYGKLLGRVQQQVLPIYDRFLKEIGLTRSRADRLISLAANPRFASLAWGSPDRALRAVGRMLRGGVSDAVLDQEYQVRRPTSNGEYANVKVKPIDMKPRELDDVFLPALAPTEQPLEKRIVTNSFKVHCPNCGETFQVVNRR